MKIRTIVLALIALTTTASASYQIQPRLAVRCRPLLLPFCVEVEPVKMATPKPVGATGTTCARTKRTVDECRACVRQHSDAVVFSDMTIEGAGDWHAESIDDCYAAERCRTTLPSQPCPASCPHRGDDGECRG